MQISYLFFLEIEQPLIAQAYCVDSGFVCLKKKKITTICAFSGSGLGISRKNRKMILAIHFFANQMIFLFFVFIYLLGVCSVYVEFTVYYISISNI